MIFAAETKILYLARAVTQSLENMAESVEPDDDFELGKEDEDSEESLLRYYFFRGFEYKEIILLLPKNHNIEMSLNTLKRRIKSYGLKACFH